VSGSQQGAVLHDADIAAGRVIRFFKTGLRPVLGGAIYLPICTPRGRLVALQMAQAIRICLQKAGVKFAPFVPPLDQR